jgi:hypothetical protein
VPDEDVMTWRELVRPDEVAGVTVAGSDAVRWAVDVHERFFGDAWLLRADTSDNRIATIVSGPLTGVVPNTSTTTGLLRTERVVMCSWVRLQGQRQAWAQPNGGVGVCFEVTPDSWLAGSVAGQGVAPVVAVQNGGQQLGTQTTTVAAGPVDVQPQ